MIICDLAGWEKEKSAYHPALQRAVQFLQQTDLVNHPLGEVEIEGRAMYANFMEIGAALPQDRKSEQHGTYIDLHLFIQGTEDEIIAVARHSEHNESIAVLEDKDSVLYKHVRGEFEIKLLPGMLAVLFPADLHRPCCSASGSGTLKKVVVKIDKALLGIAD